MTFDAGLTRDTEPAGPLEDFSWLNDLEWPLNDAPSIHSSKSNTGEVGHGAVDGDQDEMVSRFVPSASHPTRSRAVDSIEESDCSWTELDSLDEWYSELRRALRQFRQSQESTMITMPLYSRQRKQVHSMANMWGLSHVSVESKSPKRVLLSKCAIIKPNLYGVVLERKCNPLRENWSSGFMISRLVLFHWIDSSICFQTSLRHLELPEPMAVTMVIRGDYGTVWAVFETAEHAAAVVLALESTRPQWNKNRIGRAIQCRYVRFPEHFHLHPNMLDGDFCNLPHRVADAFRTLQDQNPNHPASGPSSPAPDGDTQASSIHGLSPSELRQALSEAASKAVQPRPDAASMHSVSFTPRTLSRRPSWRSSFSRDPGYLSASSYNEAGSFIDSDYSLQTSITKKRKREPKLIGGYACAHDGCGKRFDYQGELTKHEKIHKQDERKHICPRCRKGFFYPKDLKRHAKIHDANSVPVSPVVEGAIEPIDIEMDDSGLGLDIGNSSLWACDKFVWPALDSHSSTTTATVPVTGLMDSTGALHHGSAASAPRTALESLQRILGQR